MLRKIRFFGEVDQIDKARALGRRIVEGELSSGADAVKSRALAWCARFLSRSEQLEEAEEYLQTAKGLQTCTETRIADAFIASQKGDKNTALNILAQIDSPSARSAAFMVVSHHGGKKEGLCWLIEAGIEVTALDPEGKLSILQQQLEVEHWGASGETLNAITDQDLAEAPALYHVTAITFLLSAVPVEFRSVVHKQLPLDAANFPLASDAPAMEARQMAQRRFAEAAEVAHQLSCPRIATLDDEYALWLELKNPVTAKAGQKRLEEKLRDPKSALQLVPLGLQFGIEFDLMAVEQEIVQNIALHGEITPEAAIARFSLAFTQKSSKEVASYIEQHYDDLSKFIDKKTMGSLQIEALSRVGMSDKAEQYLSLLLENGLSDEDEARLRRMIAEAAGADPVEVRKEQFRQTDALNDLVALVDQLESQKNWEELSEFGDILFQRTRSLADAEALANALINAHRNSRLVEFLKDLVDLREQSRILQMFFCWSLYNEGLFLEARSELEKMSDNSDDQNYRDLVVHLGIALGDWPSLSAFVAAEYQARDQRTAMDLIHTAQLAHHLGSPRARELTFAAAAKGDNDSGLLASAYFLATKAGWEDDATVV